MIRATRGAGSEVERAPKDSAESKRAPLIDEGRQQRMSFRSENEKQPGRPAWNRTKYVYDLNGALLRAPSATNEKTSMLWDSNGRLSTFYNGTPELQNRPTERYAYDDRGYRLIRWPESGGTAAR